MKTYLVTGFVRNVWCVITITTAYPDSVVNKAVAMGMKDITCVEEG